MNLTHAELSRTGSRSENEDFLSYWQSEDAQEQRTRGGILLLADGMGGHGAGEIASQLAVTIALKTFREARATLTDNQLLWRLFTAANLAVFDAGTSQGGDRMGTTLTISLFRRNEIAVGHVGDSRAYLVRGSDIRQLTSDHTYVASQLKMNLITREEANQSELRSILTRSIGQYPTIKVDYARSVLTNHDVVIQCSDGVHGSVTDGEMRDAVNRMPPAEACDHLLRLAERRGSQDNMSIQIVRVDNVPRVGYYRGAVAYYAPSAPSMSNELQVGDVLDERFQLTDVINRSAMSSVFKATDLKTGRPVAVKVPLQKLEGDPAAFSRFEREAEIGRALDHPSILKIIPIEANRQSRPYLVMEFLEGQTLDRLLADVKPLPEGDALRIMSQIADGVAYLHGHDVVHRDLKPQNVMLCHDGSIRIMDFGIAKTASARRLTFGSFSPTMGTPDYMAPEQVKGQRGDQRTDVYGMGAILYEMVTGRLPFDGPNVYTVMNARLVGDPVAPRVHNPAISPQVEEIILHAMAREPKERYESATAMKADLDAPGQVEVSGRASRLTVPVAWKSRWRLVRVVIIGALIPVVLFFLFFLLLSRRH